MKKTLLLLPLLAASACSDDAETRRPVAAEATPAPKSPAAAPAASEPAPAAAPAAPAPPETPPQPAAAAAPTPRTPAEKIPVLIVSGASNHDWQWTSASLQRILEERGLFEVEITTEPAKTLADAEDLRRFQVLVLDYNGPRWGEPAETSFLEAVRGGTGIAVIHAGNNPFKGWEEYEKLVGDLWREGTGHGKFHAFDVVFDRGHPITHGLMGMKAHPDELYHDLVRTPGTDYAVFATAHSAKENGGTGEDEPMLFVGAYGQGRVFHTPLGHVWPGVESTRASHEDPQFRDLVARGVEWAATGSVTPHIAGLPEEISSHLEPWTFLFDGVTSRGWRGFKRKGFPERGWRIEDGCLVVEAGGGGGDILTEGVYGDFDLDLEFKLAPKANSGIIYRCTEQGETAWQSGPEFQILDDSGMDEPPEPKHAVAALYDVYEPQYPKLVQPAGTWSLARVLVRGWEVEHWLADGLVLQCDLASPDGQARIAASKFAGMPFFAKAREGHVALQDHGDEVWFRNIRIRRPLRDARIEGYVYLPPIVLFDGTNLAQFMAFLEDGAKLEDVFTIDEEKNLVCKGSPTGYLRTHSNFTNYVLELEWRFPEGKPPGNSGVLLRMVGPDKIWPKSVEAQLHHGNAGDFWCIDDFPMTTDPARTKGRNTKKTHDAEKPVGEWNRYRITVQHDRVELRVNGELVNEATDVEEVAGKICLQSEGSEIHFRNIVVRAIP
jgi:type 1 glutamine amidotransferase